MSVLPYLLKVIFCSAFLYAFYYFVLRDKFYHQYNRFYLLLLPMVSFLIPLARLPFSLRDSADSPVLKTLSNVRFSRWEQEFVVYGHAANAGYDYAAIAWFIVYLTGVVICLIPLIKSLKNIRQIVKQSSIDVFEDVTLFRTEAPGTPFSFLNSIFWNVNSSVHTREGRQMLQHELFHVKQKHSLDTIYTECLRAVFWVNPVFHLIRKEVEVIHEFLADEHASKWSDSVGYAELLIRTAIANKRHLLTNSFFHSQLKRRIAMISKKHGQKFNYIARLAVLPVVAFLFSTCGQNPEKEAITNSEVNADSTSPIAATEKPDTLPKIDYKPNDVVTVVGYRPKDSNGVAIKPVEKPIERKRPIEANRIQSQYSDSITFTLTEIEASYPGGRRQWMKYLNKNIRYPQEALKRNLEGFVVVQFIVDKEGNVSDIQALSGPETGGLREEAIDVIRRSGKWEPAVQNGQKVRAYKTQPISFKLIAS